MPVLVTLSVRGADVLLIDDFENPNGLSRLGTPWRLVTDGVMGGISRGSTSLEAVAGRRALCLRGDVRLENNGGFVQVALDLSVTGDFDASAYTGIRLIARGNDETYNLHLKSADVRFPWQSYRSTFLAVPEWREIRLPFEGFEPHRLELPLDRARLRRLGLVAIGRAFAADVCVGQVGFY
jgi:hypothetical protein